MMYKILLIADVPNWAWGMSSKLMFFIHKDIIK